MYLYYPVILISISVALLFNPIKMFYFRTRMWLLYSLVSALLIARKLGVDIMLVAFATCRHISCRVARLLPRRHVLLVDLHHGCQ